MNARAQLGAYQWLIGGNSILIDSGMLAALLPSIADTFNDAYIIHVIRDGKVGPYLGARGMWSNMLRTPAKYQLVEIGSESFH